MVQLFKLKRKRDMHCMEPKNKNIINKYTHFSLFLQIVECFWDANRFNTPGSTSRHRSVSFNWDYCSILGGNTDPKTGFRFLQLQEAMWFQCNGHENNLSSIFYRRIAQNTKPKYYIRMRKIKLYKGYID